MTHLVGVTVKALALGVVLGAVWDIVRIIRVIFGVSSYGKQPRRFPLYKRGVKDVFSAKRGKVFSYVFVAVTDVIYFTAASVVFILFLYVFNYGIFRWFIFIACIVGFLAYYNSLGRAVILVSTGIADYVKLFLNLLIFVILYPVKLSTRLIVLILRKTALPVIKRAESSIDKCKKRRYTLRCIEKLPEFVKFQGR